MQTGWDTGNDYGGDASKYIVRIHIDDRWRRRSQMIHANVYVKMCLCSLPKAQTPWCRLVLLFQRISIALTEHDVNDLFIRVTHILRSPFTL